MSRFSDSIAKALELARKRGGEAIVYRTSTDAIEILKALPLRGNERDQTGNRRVLEFDELDWGIGRADLAVDGVEFRPEKGHIIERVLHGKTLRYSAMPSQGEQPWVWSDPGGQTQYRIHTKLIGES